MSGIQIQETNDGCELIIGSTSNTFWIKPDIIKQEVEFFKVLELIESERDAIHAVEVLDFDDSEMPPRVSISKFALSCPFCSAGKNLSIDRKHWDFLFDWSFEETRLLACRVKESIKNRYAFNINPLTSQAIVKSINEYLLEQSFRPDAEEGTGAIYERIHRKQDQQLIEFNPAQLQFELPGIPLQQTAVQFQTSLLGLYRCPHCGKAFGVFFHDNKEVVFEDADFLIDALNDHIKRGQIWNYIRIHSTKEKVTVDMSCDAHSCIIEFSKELGSVRLNGRRINSDTFLREQLSRLSIDIGLFGNRDVTLKIASFLNPLPDDIVLSDGMDNLRLLMLANRFNGYPAHFYAQAAKSNTLFQQIYPAHSGFPRNFEDIEAAYAMTGLPHKKSIRRRLFNDPVKLSWIMQLHELPFENIDVINAFIDNPKFEIIARALLAWQANYHEDDLSFWSEIARLKGETILLHFLQSQTEEELTSISFELMWNLDIYDPWVQTMICKTPMHDFLRKLNIICWSAQNPTINLDEDYVYTEEQRALEASYNEVGFELPKNAREYVTASIELHNCMDSYPGKMQHLTDHTVLFVKKGDRFLGGIEVQHGKEVITARGICNKPLFAQNDLYHVILQWCKEHSLTIIDAERARAGYARYEDF